MQADFGLVSVLTLLAVLAAWFTAWLNYRTRPLALRIRELHSAALKAEISRWEREIHELCYPEYYPGVQVPKERLPVEDHVLFPDIFWHLPPGMDLQELWLEYKHNVLELHGAIHLAYQLARDAVDQMCHSLEGDVEPTDNAYDKLLKVCQTRAMGQSSTSLQESHFSHLKPESRLPILLSWGPTGIASGRTRVVLEGFDIRFRQALCAEAGAYHDEIENAWRLVMRHDSSLAVLRNTVVTHLKTLQCLPLLPNQCEHLEASADRLAPHIQWGSRLQWVLLAVGISTFIVGIILEVNPEGVLPLALYGTGAILMVLALLLTKR